MAPLPSDSDRDVLTSISFTAISCLTFAIHVSVPCSLRLNALACYLLLSILIAHQNHVYHGAWWRIGRVDTFRPEDRKFESHSSRHARTLGKTPSPSLATVCSSSACKLRHSVNCCGRERF